MCMSRVQGHTCQPLSRCGSPRNSGDHVTRGPQLQVAVHTPPCLTHLLFLPRVWMITGHGLLAGKGFQNHPWEVGDRERPPRGWGGPLYPGLLCRGLDGDQCSLHSVSG